MQVRPATLEDCEPLARGMKAVVEEGWLATEPSTSVDDIEQRFRAAVEWEGHLLFVLEEEGELAGALGMHPTQAEGVLSLGMWLLPQYRGRSGGRQLIEAALDARPPEIHKIELEVFPDNEAAIGLYRSAGFGEEGLRCDHYRRADGSLRSALIMARLF
jgi:RimJ/RimL family protein N-acetyltransferase